MQLDSQIERQMDINGYKKILNTYVKDSFLQNCLMIFCRRIPRYLNAKIFPRFCIIVSYMENQIMTCYIYHEFR